MEKSFIGSVFPYAPTLLLGIGVGIVIGAILCALTFARRKMAKESKSTQDSDVQHSDCNEVIFGPSAEEPVISISALQQVDVPATARAIDPHATQINRLSPLLIAVPNLLSAAALASGDYMRVVIDGPLALNKLKDG